MPQLSAQYDTTQALQTYLRLASVSLGLVMPPSLTYHMVQRLITVDGEAIEDAGEDPLGPLLVEAAEAMSFEERVGAHVTDVDMAASLAALFDEGDVARLLKPRLFIGLDVRGEEPRIAALLTACAWTRDDALGTARWSQQELARVGAPRFDHGWVLVDAVASQRRGGGALLVMAAYVAALRSRQHRGVVAIAVTRSGRELFERLGFTCKAYREGGASRSLCWAPCGALSLQRVRRRLAFPGDRALLESFCFRAGVRDPDKVYPRC